MSERTITVVGLAWVVFAIIAAATRSSEWVIAGVALSTACFLTASIIRAIKENAPKDTEPTS